MYRANVKFKTKGKSCSYYTQKRIHCLEMESLDVFKCNADVNQLTNCFFPTFWNGRRTFLFAFFVWLFISVDSFFTVRAQKAFCILSQLCYGCLSGRVSSTGAEISLKKRGGGRTADLNFFLTSPDTLRFRLRPLAFLYSSFLAFFLLLVCTSFAIHFDAGKKKKNRRKCRVTPQLCLHLIGCVSWGGKKEGGSSSI